MAMGMLLIRQGTACHRWHVPAALPPRRLPAPVKARPLPNISLSKACRAALLQLMAAQSGILLRGLVSQAAATSSLPVPVSPWITSTELAASSREHFAQLPHVGRTAHHQPLNGVALRQLAAQITHFQHQAALVQRTGTAPTSCSGVKGFWMKSCAIFHAFARPWKYRRGRDQHHRQLGVGAHDFLEKSHAIHLRQSECRWTTTPRKSRPSRARFSALGAFGGNAFELQGLLATQNNVGIVFDDQHPWRSSVMMVVAAWPVPQAG